jgi:hypothetical protein
MDKTQDGGHAPVVKLCPDSEQLTKLHIQDTSSLDWGLNLGLPDTIRSANLWTRTFGSLTAKENSHLLRKHTVHYNVHKKPDTGP